MPYARRDTVEFIPGEYYHIYNRGARQLTLFHERSNYQLVLQHIGQYFVELNLSLIAYCLLPNHYHWAVRQDGSQPAGLLPQRVFNRYSKAYNVLYQHSGTLFQGRYQAKHVDSQVYLMQLCRYIHGNPVRHGICRNLNDWQYSNYPEWIGRRSGKLVDRELVASRFPDPKEYEAFVMEGLRMNALPQELTYLEGFGAAGR